MRLLFVIFESFTKCCLVDADRLLSEILNHVLTHVSRNAGNLHEIEIEVALRVLYTADTHLVTVNEGEDMELLVLSVLLAYLLAVEAAEGDVHLWVLTEDLLLPTFSLCVKTRLLNDIVRAFRVMDHRISSVLVHALLAEVSVDWTLLAVEVETEVVIHLVCI